MTQKEALMIMKTGANVFLTGEPGAGKTFTINKYVEYLREHEVPHAVTASTGIAATHIGGMTIHSYAGIGIKNTLTKYDLDKIASTEYIAKRIRKTKVLIIDEVSMLHADTLAMVDAVCREVKQNPEPFGGMQVILVGDFFQLPPIEKKSDEIVLDRLLDEESAHFAYEGSTWQRLNPVICYLTEQHRQDDTEYLNLLNAIRQNNFDEDHYESLKSRFTSIGKELEHVTKLYSHNLNVDTVNDKKLAELKGEPRTFEMIASGKTALVTALKKGCLSPEVLCLKKGAVVMCTKNNPKDRFVNGTMGTVVDFESFSNYPIIETKSGRTITIAPMDWVVEENGKIKAQITQVPLRLAWAITVHKSQGMSLDSAVMDLSGVFEYGQGYVALSRVRRMSGLYLLGINNKALEVHPKILAKDNAFRNLSESAINTFCILPEKEIQAMHKNFILAQGGKWE